MIQSKFKTCSFLCKEVKSEQKKKYKKEATINITFINNTVRNNTTCFCSFWFKQLYSCTVCILSVISYFPQTIKLIKTKKSNDLSIQSWILWVTSSLAYTIYAIVVSKDFMLIFETSLELSFCLLILMLAIRYRNN